MNTQKIREMTDAELDNQLKELNQEKFNLKIQARTGQLENPARFKQLRKDAARILTEQNARAVTKQ
jgi:large subunit ribosomal protein L29